MTSDRYQDYRQRVAEQIHSGRSVEDITLDSGLMEQVRPYGETVSAMSVVKKELLD